jgi:hypothetical protein
MKKLAFSLIGLIILSLGIYSCNKEAIRKTSIISKSGSNIQNINHLNNILADQNISNLISSKYTIDLMNVKGKYNVDYKTGQILTNEYVFSVPANLILGADTTISNSIIIVSRLDEGKAIILEESRILKSNGNIKILLNVLGNNDKDAFQYCVNSSGIGVDEDRMPCNGGSNDWWDCMKCVYSRYTSDLTGQLTWVPVGCSIASIYCMFLYPSYHSYILPS